MDEQEFRRLVGGKEEPKESPEEVQARKERVARGEGTTRDVFAELPGELQRRRDYYLGLYGLNPPFGEEAEQHSEDMARLMSEDQREQYLRASSAYRKRRLPTRDQTNPTNSLEAFAATNPPEVLRRHVWRLQRGMDEPMFGAEEPRKANKVREYNASLSVSLCDSCAEELRAETEASGAERNTISKEKDTFYDRDSPAGLFLFKYGNVLVEMERASFFGFPYSDPKTCERCGEDEVDMWHETFG
jgi:hypothetical protein